MMAVVSSTSGARRPDLKAAYRPADFERIATFLHQSTGILLTESNDRMVYARLAARVLELGLDSFSAYLDHALDPRATEERDRLISALTTNTTHFYRESYHFDYLETHVLPGLIARAKAGERIRIWSAGCSTGEEAYSIAICILNAFPDASRHDLKVLATDVDRAALARATAATYAPNSLRDLSQTLQIVGFDRLPSSDQWTPKPQVRSLVTFRHLNLIGDWPFRGQFDVIAVWPYRESGTDQDSPRPLRVCGRNHQQAAEHAPPMYVPVVAPEPLQPVRLFQRHSGRRQVRAGFKARTRKCHHSLLGFAEVAVSHDAPA